LFTTYVSTTDHDWCFSLLLRPVYLGRFFALLLRIYLFQNQRLFQMMRQTVEQCVDLRSDTRCREKTETISVEGGEDREGGNQCTTNKRSSSTAEVAGHSQSITFIESKEGD